MAKTIISEGKTSTEAIEKGLKQLNVSKDKVDIKILENEEKRSFFSILTPRVVKVELTLKENMPEKKSENEFHRKQNRPSQEEKTKEHEVEERKRTEKIVLKPEEIEMAKENLEIFLNEFITKISSNIEYKIISDDEYIYVTLNGEEAGRLIGYRGETLNAMQLVLSSIANKKIEGKVRIILDIENYREKRKISLEELADKLERTVIRNGKQVTLEPMSAYERKIIHNRLQDSQRVKTYSVGEEPYRKVVITKK